MDDVLDLKSFIIQYLEKESKPSRPNYHVSISTRIAKESDNVEVLKGQTRQGNRDLEKGTSSLPH